jgi:hypothetical protein
LTKRRSEITEGLFIGPEDISDYCRRSRCLKRCFIRKKGERLHVRCNSQDDMVEFRSYDSWKLLTDPVRLWRIKVPTEVKIFDLRDHKRIQCSVSADIEAVHTGQFVTGIIRDISKSGARCMFQRTEDTESAFKMDQQITLALHVPGYSGRTVHFRAPSPRS